MSLIKKFATVGGATMSSRVLGFVREALIAATLAAGPVADAFYAAFAFPNLFRRILADGAFNFAFIPLFAKELEGGGRAAAERFAQQVLSVLLVVLLALCGACIVFMPWIVGTVVAPGFESNPEKFDITVSMARIMFPYLLCMSLAAMISGILNSMRHYFIPALLPVLLNVLLVGVALLALYRGFDDVQTGFWLAWGVTLSGILQLVLVYWTMRKQDFGLSLTFPRLSPSVKRLLILMGPAVLTGGVVQINIMIGRIIASAQDGAIALLNYADRINQLPLGVIGIAVGVVLLPELSRALKSSDHAEVQYLQNRSMEFALALTLPAAVGLMIMPGPIVNILFERGAFDAQTTAMTASALAAFAAGLPAYVLLKVFQPAYFAREDMNTPLWFSIVSVVLNVVLSLSLFPRYGHVAIALATAVSSWVQVCLLAYVLWRRSDFSPSRQTMMRIVSMAAASVLMGLVLMGMLDFGAAYIQADLLGVRVASVAGTIVVAAAIYFLFLILTGGIERADLMRLVRRKRPSD